tara:strand:- start:2334 stop:2642 length:309 start_codon:yes stop_codon:yes gene_type:complete
MAILVVINQYDLIKKKIYYIVTNASPEKNQNIINHIDVFGIGILNGLIYGETMTKNKEEDLMVITKEEYDALGQELLRSHLINIRYQARCKCDIDFSNFVED